jgi:ubiquinone/menaquinone biosynthesis C-methylase UbiE
MGRLWSAVNSRVCPRWFIGSFDNPLRHRFHDPRAMLAPLVRENEVVADIGCGMGYFAVPLAELVGPGGRVLAVDLQEAMLEGVRRRALAAGVLERMRFHRALSGDLCVEGPVSFALAFWMVHEVPEKTPFFRQLRGMLAPDGTFLMVEPRIHVSAAAFLRSVEEAKAAGLTPVNAPRVRLSRAVLFRAGSSTDVRSRRRP